MKKLSAKEIFFLNSGNYYHMAHDGFYDDYLKYNIDKKTEEKWTEELIKLRFKEFKQTFDIRYLIPLVDDFNTYNLIEKLINIKFRGTFINKFVVLELLTKLLMKNKNEIEKYKEIKTKIVINLRILLSEEIPKEYFAWNIENRIVKIKNKLRIK
jgi:hypothetical protein